MHTTSSTPRTRPATDSKRTRTPRRTGSTAPGRANATSRQDVAGAARRRRADQAVVSQWLLEQMEGRDPLRDFFPKGPTG